MQITAIHERSVAISRYADPLLASGGLTTSLIAVETDVRPEGGLLSVTALLRLAAMRRAG